ncbi:MAG: hypothetical protein HY747_12335 [Elusimicrobia bacterium]|nr:hypothetical protein [Elusimicrobiota bacterium]
MTLKTLEARGKAIEAKEAKESLDSRLRGNDEEVRELKKELEQLKQSRSAELRGRSLGLRPWPSFLLDAKVKLLKANAR